MINFINSLNYLVSVTVGADLVVILQEIKSSKTDEYLKDVNFTDLKKMSLLVDFILVRGSKRFN